jgi:RNA polymerase sigma factor (TIGR02999 family)
MMRRVLVDHARKRKARGRGGQEYTLTLERVRGSSEPAIDVVRLHDALNGLTELDSRQAEIVELRYFGGHSIEETAEVLGVSPATVKREWTTARMWLLRELRRTEAPDREPKSRRPARSSM